MLFSIYRRLEHADIRQVAVLLVIIQSVADYKAGKDKAIGFLVGQVMKKSRGKANPGMVNKLIIKTIKGE